MSRALIIVESPAKIKTIKSFLGDKYVVKASMGHVMDLPSSKLGVDIEHNFAPAYEVIPEKKNVITDLKKSAQSASEVYLATDPDREGEAIAWHLARALELKDPRRIQFNQITRSAVEEALKHPQDIDNSRVDAQQARRVLDRLVGYKLSPLLWKKVRKGLSAGRVQSVAVRMVVDREREITAFIPEEYWSIIATLAKEGHEESFEARLHAADGKKIDNKKNKIADKAAMEAILAGLHDAVWQIANVTQKEQKRNPAPPFITSTLQQEAARKLGFSARRTMAVAQQLYEGIEMGEAGHVGLITYMRTDSTNVAPEAQQESRNCVMERFGKEYLPEKPPVYRSRRGAQEAHEAIRPASVMRSPEDMKKWLSHDQIRLYDLIWKRFLASQMSPLILDGVTIDINVGSCIFRATGSTVKFPGFSRLYTEGADDSVDEEARRTLPAMKPGERLDCKGITPKQHFTQAPPRYTEATLIKTLEEKGIGRPSTYAPIIYTIQERGYVEQEEKRFRPTELGILVTDLLVQYFPAIMDTGFTARVEQDLDQIEEQGEDWHEVISAFYHPFETALHTAEKEAEKRRPTPVETEEVCEKCGRKMVIKEGRFGKFLACPGFPECRNTRPIRKTVGARCPRPECEGELVERKGKRSRIFHGCSRYPACDFVVWGRISTEHKCSRCGGPTAVKGSERKGLTYTCIDPGCPECGGAGNDQEKPTEAAE
ncbi:MAG: type I DNA topoisomerase [bacterium]|jgi:DNA topoisomerase-1